jgi:hypothetical protein
VRSLRWDRSVYALAILVSVAFVAGLLGAPILYLLTYGQFWSSMGTALTGFAVLGMLVGGMYGFAGLFGKGSRPVPGHSRNPRPHRQPEVRLPSLEPAREIPVVRVSA